jgi:hypothetical protein
VCSPRLVVPVVGRSVWSWLLWLGATGRVVTLLSAVPTGRATE